MKDIVDKRLLGESRYGLFDMVVASMEVVESMVDMSGPEKKDWVLKQMKEVLGDETYDRYKDVLPSMIDFIIAISKNKYFLSLNNVKEKCSGCFPW